MGNGVEDPSEDIPQQPTAPLETCAPRAHIILMVDSDKGPVMEPFPDKEGTGWHVIIRYREGHERRIEGFASKADAVDWIEANLGQVDK
jgi:hypothetical protein